MLINKDKSLLMIIDIQERLTPKLDNTRTVINGATRLVEVANTLNVPYFIAEQYKKGLGQTIFDIKNAAKEDTTYIEKTTFSCTKEDAIIKEIKKHKKKQIIISGIETHICVLQTAIGLKEMGYDVFVVSDACGSRDSQQSNLAYQRLMKNGVEVVSTEMVMFEWLEDSKAEHFKEISKRYFS